MNINLHKTLDNCLRALHLAIKTARENNEQLDLERLQTIVDAAFGLSTYLSDQPADFVRDESLRILRECAPELIQREQ